MFKISLINCSPKHIPFQIVKYILFIELDLVDYTNKYEKVTVSVTD